MEKDREERKLKHCWTQHRENKKEKRKNEHFLEK